MEYECWRMAPEGVSIHTSRVAHTEDTEEALRHQVESAPHAAVLLSHAKVNAICFGCTAAGFVKKGADVEIINSLEDAARTPSTTTATAIKDALTYLGIRSVAIASPYPEFVNDLLGDYLGYAGIRMVSQKGLDTECPSFLSPDNAYKLAAAADSEDAEAILIGCTNLRSLEVIEQLESDAGKPVVTSNSSVMWKLIQLVGEKLNVSGAGVLFK